MSFLAPTWLAAAAIVAAGVIVAHLFATHAPPRDVLPTVRFVPDAAPTAVLRTRRISDPWLLALRLLAVALLGMALAGAHAPRTGPKAVIVADVSRAVASLAELRDSVAAHDGILILTDSVARAASRDTLESLRASVVRGSLSAGIAAAHRAIARVSDGRDSIALVVVSPFARESVDSATRRLLALWEGPVRIVRVAVAASPQPLGWEMRAPGNDPVAASLAFAQHPDAPIGVRIVRTAPTAADSAWVAGSRESRVLVLWPNKSAAGTTLAARGRTDTTGGFATEHATVIGAFARAYVPAAGSAIARWMDGEVAATERTLGAGCVREVAIPVNSVGDLALRGSFRAFARGLLAPCGGMRDFTSVPDSSLLTPAVGPPREASAIPATHSTKIPLLLALLALGALVAEQLLRRRSAAAARPAS